MNGTFVFCLRGSISSLCGGCSKNQPNSVQVLEGSQESSWKQVYYSFRLSSQIIDRNINGNRDDKILDCDWRSDKTESRLGRQMKEFVLYSLLSRNTWKFNFKFQVFSDSKAKKKIVHSVFERTYCAPICLRFLSDL